MGRLQGGEKADQLGTYYALIVTILLATFRLLVTHGECSGFCFSFLYPRHGNEEAGNWETPMGTDKAPKKALVRGPGKGQPRKTEVLDNSHPHSHHLCMQSLDFYPPKAVPKQATPHQGGVTTPTPSVLAETTWGS